MAQAEARERSWRNMGGRGVGVGHIPEARGRSWHRMAQYGGEGGRGRTLLLLLHKNPDNII